MNRQVVPSGESPGNPLFEAYLSPWQSRKLVVPTFAFAWGAAMTLGGLLAVSPALIVAGVLTLGLSGWLAASRFRSVNSTPVIRVYPSAMVWGAEEFPFESAVSAHSVLLEGRRGFVPPRRALSLEFADGRHVTIGPEFLRHADLHRAILERLPRGVSGDSL